MDVKMNEESALHLIERIQTNQPWRSTWKAELNGNPCIAKLIECQDSGICQRLSASLNKQLRFSETLAPEDAGSICLFNAKVELNENQIAFCRSYVDGKALDTLLEEHDFSISEAVELIRKVSAIIAKAHNVYKVSHGDLKPANIIIGSDKEPVIIDWDTMRVVASVIDLKSKEKTITLDQTSAGTPKYMPPEQCRGEKIDEQCDVYALGIILYQLINHGKTPFDEPPYSSMNTLQLIAAKAQPIDSLSVKHPELKVNVNLSNIIDKAVAPDRNSRYDSVDSLINDLNNLIQLPSPTEVISTGVATTPVNTDNEIKRKKDDKPATNLVLIGHPQSGKTVLAAGLYATSSNDFTVEAIDSDTKNQAINTKSILQKAEWPAKTGMGTIKNLNFRILNRKRESVIRFDEYAGELISTVNYFSDVLKKPDGVLILLNAGAPQLHDPLQRNTMLADFSNCITYLCDLPNHPPIAFVVTASDRLSTDLKDWKEEFEEYAGKVTESLQNHKCKWKRFDVSICGNLEKQESPKLEPHNIHEPFMWLIKVLRDRKRINIAKSLGLAAILIALIALVIVAVKYKFEGDVTKNLKNDLASIQAYSDGKTEPDDLLNYLRELLNKRCQYCTQNHISHEKHLGSRLSACDESCATKKFWFERRKEAFDSAIKSLEENIDRVKVKYLSKLLDDAIKKTDDAHYDAIKKDFDNWTPLHDHEQKNPEVPGKLAYRIKQELEPARERYVFAEMKRKVQAISEDDTKEQFPTELDNKIDEWLQRTTVLPNEEREANKKEIIGLRTDARQTCERRFSELLIKDLLDIQNRETLVFSSEVESRVSQWNNKIKYLDENEKADFKKKISDNMLKAKTAVYSYNVKVLSNRISSFSGTDNDLAKLLSDYNSFLENKPEIDVTIIEKHKNNLAVILKNCLEKYVDDLCMSFRKKQMDSKVELPEDFTSSLNAKIYPLISNSLKASLQVRTSSALKSIKDDWDEQEHKKITDFIAKYKRYDIDTLLRDFCIFCNHEIKNKYLSEAETLVLERIYEKIEPQYNNIRNRDVSTSFFSDFKIMCAAIKNKCGGSPMIRKHKIYAWICDYLDWEQANVTFGTQISDLKIKVDYSNPDDPYVKRVLLKRGETIKINYSISGWGGDVTRFNTDEYKTYRTKSGLYTMKFDCKLGEFIDFVADVYDEKEDPDESVGYVYARIYPGLDKVYPYIQLRCSTNNVMGRLYIDVDGEPFDFWLRTHSFPRR